MKSKIIRLLKNLTSKECFYWIVYYLVSHTGIYKFMSDKSYISLKYRCALKKALNLNDPRTFTEKLNWQKLYDRNPLYIKLVDKYEVKDYVKEIIGEDYIIKTLGIYNNASEIDFEKLPNSFVLKCTHDSGGIVICKDKEKLDIKKARQIIQKNLERNFYYDSREWPYKNVIPRIIAEAYMEDSVSKDLKDYKFFCFDGKVGCLFVATERQTNKEPYFDFFDIDYNHLDLINGHPNAKLIPQKPINFEIMKELASKLSKGLPQVRVDFYEVDGHIYFGEMTFFHFGGFTPFEPDKWDKILGDMIKLPSK